VERRTIFVYLSIGPSRVIRLLLELPLEEGDLMPMAELVHGYSGFLVPRKNGMKFVNDTLGKFTLSGDAIDHELNSRFLVCQDVN
jgi:hypothetical protein